MTGINHPKDNHVKKATEVAFFIDFIYLKQAYCFK